MSTKQEIILTLENLSEAELQQVAEYIAFLKSRRKSIKENHYLPEENTAKYRQSQKGVIRSLIRFFGGYDRQP